MNNYLLNMTRRVFMVVMFLFCTAAGWAQTYQNGMRKGQIKVKFASSMTTTVSKMKVSARSGNLTTGIQSFDAAAKKASATNMYRLFPANAKNENKLHKHGLDLWYVVEIKENVDPKMAIAQFKQLNEIAVAEVEHEKVLSPFQVTAYTPGASPMATLPFNDPFLKDQWHYNNTGQAGIGDADVNLFEAWKETAGASDIIVSVHDQGIDVAHKDLRSNIWVNTIELNGANGVDDDGNGYVDDINGYNFQKNKGAVDAEFHGTHVAGTIAAVNNNGIGVAGVAGGTGNGDGVKVMSLQIFGGLFENSYIYAADNGAVISQNSWGYTNPGIYDQSVNDAIDYFVAEAGNYPGSPMKGGLVIFAAGNSSSNYDWYPGYYNKTLSVASLGPEGKRAYYSNYGPWVEIAAPGGDQDYGAKGGVLSTTPKDQYAYLQGTSMACPHVSGIAALALANRTEQMTNTELWNQLVTGVVSLDENNPDFTGMLGSGAIDAALAIQNDLGIAPAAINSLDVTGMSQEFATLSWNVPTDTDDKKPVAFQLYYSIQPITLANLASATKIVINNTKAAGEKIEYEVADLLSLTTYHFAITSSDRWGNVSALSNVVSDKTNKGPAISVDENSQSIDLTIDITEGTTASHEITIKNDSAGILRWKHLLRHRSTELSFNASNIHYPTTTKKETAGASMGRMSLSNNKAPLRSAEAAPMAFTEITKQYAEWADYIVGDTDLSLTNSSATKFLVTETEGFNLTQVSAYIKHDPAKGPVILEIYKGASPAKNNLVLAQEYSMWSKAEGWANITLDEQLYFESGETFWVVVHVPANNLYPLGMGYENEENGSKNCFYSVNLGQTWMPMEEAVNDKRFAWVVTAVSGNATLGNYITLEPGSGDVDGMSSTLTTLITDGSTLINGSYSANMVITSNDINQKELRIPVNVTVSGHQPDIKHIDIADFGNVFLGETKTLEIVLDNQGFGNFNEPSFNVTGAGFVIGDAPWQIKARSEVTVEITFTPSQVGNNNGVLSFTNGTQNYEIALFGMGVETSRIAITPENQLKSNITIGDEVAATITVQNQGAYPLKYFVPGFDNKGVSNDWPSDYHSYGYKVRSNQANETDQLAYEFQDIKGTGIDISGEVSSQYEYYTIDMGFDFRYYNRTMTKLYVARNGFTTFDNTVNPINFPALNNPWNPRGYISLIGTNIPLLTQGKILYQVEADRVIVQYDNVTDGYNGSITAQMVLFFNGDIRFYYEVMEFDSFNQKSFNILIEDYDQQDGIMINNYDQNIGLFEGMAIGFDYPGPDIITSVENGSGILAPGTSATVNLSMNTANLSEGTVNRYVNFISNDPTSPSTIGSIELQINQGGVAKPTVSIDTVTFGNVFQGAIKSKIFTVKNTGTKDVSIVGLDFVNNDFNIIGNQSNTVSPGLYDTYKIQVPTNTLSKLEDWLSINYADGTHDTIYVTANIVVAPSIDVDLSTLKQTLHYGDSISIPFTMANTGLGTLEVSANGKQWLSFEAPGAPMDITYVYEKENTGGVYQWIDIRKTGTQLPFWTTESDDGFWRDLTLPFPIEFYGEHYTSLKIGDNGIISFEDDPALTIFNDVIPSVIHSGPCIMPYWTQSGFDTYSYPAEEVGIFYQFYDDQIIITWSYFVNLHMGHGEPVSAQIIFFKNGTMKFQYKPVEAISDFTTRLTTIGLQKDSEHGVFISDYMDVDHGKGLAYVVLPAKKFSIVPNTTLTGAINIDARNVYGGLYNEVLKIQTNAPGNENLEKPVELTVTGDAEFTATDSVKFGTRMIVLEWDFPKPNTVDLTFRNEGAAPYEITWAQMTDGTQGLSMLLEVDGMFGKEWWDISNIYSPWSWETPSYTLMPGDVLNAKAVFYPSMVGEFVDELVITTSIGDQHIVLTGSAIDPPLLNVVQDPIVVNLNLLTETDTRTIDFGNIEGKTDLTYALQIEYSREAAPIPESTERMAESVSNKTLKSVKANGKVGTRAQTTYNRTISHTNKTIPDDFVGNGGPAITLATKYNAGPDGFNITHIETYMRREALTEGTLEVAVRVGGSGITSSPVVATGKLNFSGIGTDENGAWYQIKLDKSAMINPNENFYISVSYPFGIENAQGSITDSETITRYYYEEEGYWYDVQKVEGLETYGWLMFGAEEHTLSWLSVSSATDGTLAAGESNTATLSIDGALAERGDQYASVVFATNDPVNPTVKVPVTLHFNEGPTFSGGSTTVIISEGEEVTLNFNVTDKEGNTFTITPAASYKGTSHTLDNGKLNITLSPDYDDSGNYTYIFKATDQYGAVTELTLSVEVMQSNQAPVYIAIDETKTLEYNSIGKLYDYSLGEFFADPDEDAVTFNVVSGNIGIADVFASTNHFMVRPIAMGETTLAFAITDSHGAVLYDTITVVVNNILGLEEEASSSVKVYPNPVQQFAKIFLSYEWKGAVKLEIVDAAGRQHLVQEVDATTSHDIQLNVSNLQKGFYVLRAASADKKVSVKLIKD
ncbi:MAG: S8 family serine peptidase [Chryseolinea sp.]